MNESISAEVTVAYVGCRLVPQTWVLWRCAMAMSLFQKGPGRWQPAAGFGHIRHAPEIGSLPPFSDVGCSRHPMGIVPQ